VPEEPVQGPQPPPIDATGTPPTREDRPFDPEPLRESKRGQIAMWLIWILAGTVIAMFTLAGGGWVSLSDSVPVLATVVGVVGGAIGFYFGGGAHPRPQR